MVSGAGAVGLACAEPSTAGPVIGLALGSGAARGWAHLGVLQELAREGVVPQIITGCSIGAFVGAAAASGDLAKLVRWAETLKWQDVVSLLDVSLRGGLIKGQKLIDFFERNGPAGLIVSWAGPGITKQPIPALNWFQSVPCPGDRNLDATVNVDDLNIVLSQWGMAVPPFTGGDDNGDGQVTVNDLNIILSHWANTCP